jgi:hypothetical protein
MKLIIKIISLSLIMISSYTYSESNHGSLFSFAENMLEIEGTAPNIIFSSNDEIGDLCSDQLIACFRSDKPSNIYIQAGLQLDLLNTTLVGLMSDYLQFNANKNIDNLKSCNAQVDYLLSTFKVNKAKIYKATACGRKTISNKEMEILLASN